MPEIGVRYCGGCNPRYDRVALVKRLGEYFPALHFVPAQAGRPYPAVLVVCGCPNCCADVRDLAVPANRMLYLKGWEDMLSAQKCLAEILALPVPEQLTHAQVLALLPHRPPLLFVDTVGRLIPGVEAVASFFADPALPAFRGHFPDMPVFPGTYSLEAMAQTAGLLLLRLPRYAGMLPLFIGVERASFRRKILPGDTIEIHACLLQERPELGAAICKCQIFRGDALAADGELSLAMRARNECPHRTPVVIGNGQS